MQERSNFTSNMLKHLKEVENTLVHVSFVFAFIFSENALRNQKLKCIHLVSKNNFEVILYMIKEINSYHLCNFP